MATIRPKNNKEKFENRISEKQAILNSAGSGDASVRENHCTQTTNQCLQQRTSLPGVSCDS